jgi:hypothetical protein
MFDPGRAVRHLLLTVLLLVAVAYLVGPAPGLAATAAKKATGSPSSAGAGMAANAVIATDVFSSGGEEGTSASFKLHDTFGQGPIGPLAVGATKNVQDGFWATIGAKAPAPGDTTHPGHVEDFEAFPGDTSILLAWYCPLDTDFAGILIRFSTTGAPVTLTDGAAVPNGDSGEFWGPLGSGDDWVHPGLTNGTTYYYTAFAFDSSYNYSSGVSISAVPQDTIRTGPVTSFTATAGDSSVTLRWTNPSDSDFKYALIKFGTDHAPWSWNAGYPVPNGNDGKFPNTPASADSFVHEHLTNGVTYYYSIWCTDEVPNYSYFVDASATPRDTIPPGFVQWFTATPGERSDTLKWQNPTDIDLKEVWIRYSTTGWAYTPTQGSPVENGTDGRFTDMVPAAINSFVHTGLTPGTTYNYSVFTFDRSNNYPGYTSGSATPFDHTPPGLSVSVFQNPYVTNHLDVYLVASEPVIDASVVVSINTAELAMTNNDPEESVWRGDYDLCCTGELTIEACASDQSSNDTCVTRSFSSTLMMASSGGVARSVDGRLKLTLPRGALTRDAYVLIFESEGSRPGQKTVYDISPPGLEIGDFAEISIAYADTTSQLEHLCIAKLDGDRPIPVDSYIDKDGRRVIGYVKGLGSYGLICRPDAETPMYVEGEFRVLRNVPNPFVGSTSIVFEVARAGRVRVEIVSVDGRYVRTLTDEFVTPGRNSIDWDCCDDNGRRVSGGVYVCRVGFGSETVNHKMIHLR